MAAANQRPRRGWSRLRADVVRGHGKGELAGNITHVGVLSVHSRCEGLAIAVIIVRRESIEDIAVDESETGLVGDFVPDPRGALGSGSSSVASAHVMEECLACVGLEGSFSFDVAAGVVKFSARRPLLCRSAQKSHNNGRQTPPTPRRSDTLSPFHTRSINPVWLFTSRGSRCRNGRFGWGWYPKSVHPFLSNRHCQLAQPRNERALSPAVRSEILPNNLEEHAQK